MSVYATSRSLVPAALSYTWLQAVISADMQGPGLTGREQTQKTRVSCVGALVRKGRSASLPPAHWITSPTPGKQPPLGMFLASCLHAQQLLCSCWDSWGWAVCYFNRGCTRGWQEKCRRTGEPHGLSGSLENQDWVMAERHRETESDRCVEQAARTSPVQTKPEPRFSVSPFPPLYLCIKENNYCFCPLVLSAGKVI